MDDEASAQMRRSISMPVKPLHLEPKALKRSHEKETVFATDESDTASETQTEDESDTNCLKQRLPLPTLNEAADNQRDNENNTSKLRSVTKPLRYVRNFLANSMNPFVLLFRKRNPTRKATLKEVNGAMGGGATSSGSSRTTASNSSPAIVTSEEITTNIATTSTTSDTQSDSRKDIQTTAANLNDQLDETMSNIEHSNSVQKPLNKNHDNGHERVTFSLSG